MDGAAHTACGERVHCRLMDGRANGRKRERRAARAPRTHVHAVAGHGAMCLGRAVLFCEAGEVRSLESTCVRGDVGRGVRETRSRTGGSMGRSASLNLRARAGIVRVATAT